MEKKCLLCGEPFIPKRKTAKYCSEKHRVMDFYKRAKNSLEKNKISVENSESKIIQTLEPKTENIARSQESLINERLGADVASFCNNNNCTWDDVAKGYLDSLKPIKAKVKVEKSENQVEQKPKSSGGGYDRRASKLGF